MQAELSTSGDRYACAAQIAKQAQSPGLSLRDAALASGSLSAEPFDTWVDARRRLGPNGA